MNQHERIETNSETAKQEEKRNRVRIFLDESGSREPNEPGAWEAPEEMCGVERLRVKAKNGGVAAVKRVIVGFAG